MKTTYNNVREWYAIKTNRTTGEFDDHDNHVCKVAYEYASELISPTEKIDIISGSYWFENMLGLFQRDNIRFLYELNRPTLKITDEVLDGVLKLEMAKPIHSRTLDPRFYPKQNQIK